MRKAILFLVLFSVSFIACKKDDEDNKEYNKIRITAGAHEGFTLQFSPNKGFWGQATPDVRSYRLIFGDVVNPPVANADIGDIFFYAGGAVTVNFPSADGQQMRFVLNIDGTICTLQASDVSLRVDEVTDDRIKGFISGELQDSCSGNTSAIEMDFEIELVGR
jgi:hypothetical protein